jgi:hypothetical protein
MNNRVDGSQDRRQAEMFKKILIANRGARAKGAVAQATNCIVIGTAEHAGEFTPGARHV